MRPKLQTLLLSFVLGSFSLSVSAQTTAGKSIELIDTDINSISIDIKNIDLKYKWIKMSIDETNIYFRNIAGVISFDRSPLERSAGLAKMKVQKSSARKILKDDLGFTDAELAQYNFIP